MTLQPTHRYACLFSVLHEIAQAVKFCEYEILALEDRLLDWINVENISSIPVQDLQRIDYLRQMQSDLSSALLHISKNDVGITELKMAEVEIDEVLKILSLGENKERLLRATSAHRESSALQPEAVHNSSDVLLFFDE